ncbi:uncharacterized protein DUF397 [Streptomyces sp. KhCrAH-43]|uniref:DUF397 domain-containing protein n=1 Tax=unclassified Streptomyces TaxID=2593676 RepID=UPI000367C482|nr:MULTISPECIES: DUF397 domain-containing protein [unclassified Streptomyces]MYS37969.1 DUF397 domain-containing protein [Streptomyces sp. SID4920]MYX66156.1 DUF397 domain-containing protein [Streptomyces sp. SID8373]RAJ67640.1 uncharacterized protein DUF397 [Streptomyces sp. KhCrAH-43]
MSTSGLTWFKSSYSGSQGDSCVEVAMDWRKSTYSGSEGDNCVEVATCPAAVHVRDSKDQHSPELALSPSTWSEFVAYAAQG